MAGALRELIELLLTEIAISGTDGKNKTCSFLLQQPSRVSATSPYSAPFLSFFVSLAFLAILFISSHTQNHLLARHFSTVTVTVTGMS